MNFFGRCCSFVAMCAGLAIGQVQLEPASLMPLNDDPRERFDNHHLVEIHTHTQQELDAALEIAENIWSEGVRIGHLRVQYAPDALVELSNRGIEFEILLSNVQALIDAEWQQLQQLSLQRGLSWYQTYRQLGEYTTKINELAQTYPSLMTTQVIGQSIQGRDIPIMRISAPGDVASRPAAFIVGGQHAREWISPMTVMYLAESLLEGYGSDPRITAILDNTEIIIAPIANPDGYLYTWTNNRLWRKNRRSTFGVDLNRNWGFQWGGNGSSGNTDSDIYRGTAPFSEPETNAIRLFVENDGRVVSHIDYHSFSQLILWPYGYAAVDPPAAEKARFDDLCHDMRDDILNAGGVPYTPQPSYELYDAAGVAADWFYGSVGASGITIELRDTGNFGFELPPSQIIPTVQENLPAFLTYIERTTAALELALVQGVPTSIDTAGQTIDIRITNIASTLQNGSGMLRYRIGAGSFIDVPLSSLGNNIYRGTFGSVPCDATVEFYFQASGSNGQIVTLPAAGAASPFAATAIETDIAFLDDIEAGVGQWIVGVAGDNASTGQWERGIPQATNAQPGADNTPTGQFCFITGAASGGSLGANDVDGGTTTLITPRMDASGASADLEAYLVYHRWYSNDQGAAPNADSMPIDISNNDGQTWTQLELVTENLNRWERKEFRIADFVTPTSQMRVRFRARDLDAGSIVEAGIDDVSIELRGCPCAPADFNCDGTLDFFDIAAFLGAFAAQEPAADFNNDGVYDFFDIAAYLGAFSQG